MLRRLTLLALVLAPVLADPVAPPAVPAHTVLMVVGSGPQRTGDDSLRRHLEKRGYEVVLTDDSSVLPADLEGKLLVLISSSVSDSKLGAQFRDAALPVVVLAPLLYDDLGMAAGSPGEGYGYDSTLGRAGLEIVQPDHSLAGGLSGQVAVSKRPADFGWAMPTSGAIVAAEVGDGSPRATIFGYEAGTALVDLEAPARRVGHFVTEEMAPFLTPEGWILFDAAIDWASGLTRVVEPALEEAVSSPASSPGKRSKRRDAVSGPSVPLAPQTALFVVGNLTLNSGDTSAKTRLENLGFTLTIKTGPQSATADATGQTLVVISSTVTPTDVNTKFRNVAVPVVTWESGIFANMNMTGTGSANVGTQTNQTQVVIATATHPLAGGLTGTVAVTTAPSTYVWGAVSATGVKAATIVGQTGRAAIFGYETGATMVGLAAPARRVGLFLQDTTSLTTNGGTLFDAAIKWASNRPPVVNAGPDQTVQFPAAAALSGAASDDGLPIPPATLTTTWSKVSGPGTVNFGVVNAPSTTATFSVAGSYVLRLSASDGQVTTTDDITILSKVNAAPAVNAGPDIEIHLPSSATLDGTVTDDGLPAPPVVTVTWSKLSGPGTVTFGNANAVDTTASFSVAGTYVLRLTASDGALSTSDDASVVVNNPATCVFVVGNTTLNAADAAIKTRLQNLGLVPLVRTGVQAAASDATGKLVVVISSTVTPTDVNTKFRNVAVPVVTWESSIFDDMNMTGTTTSGFGTQTSQTQVAIVTATHPLAAGLSGNQTVVPAPSTFAWGLPSTGGTKIATIVGNANRATIFGYETGATMVGLAAPARRVGLFLQDTTALTATGGTLFDASINWAVNRPPLVTAGTDQTITLPSTAALAGTASDDGRPNPPGTLTTTWSKVSGTGTVIFGNPNSVSTTATFSAASTYVLRLTATDGQTAVTDDVQITVNPAPPNVAPNVNAGPDLAVTLPQSAALHGTVTDDGKPNPPAAVIIGWTKISGPGTVIFANPAVADTTATFSLSGTYVVRLTGNDSALSSTNDATVVVSDPPADTLFVVGSITPLSAADTAVKTRLEGLGRTVFVKVANGSLVTADANGRTLIVISSTVSPGSVGTKFTSVAVPVVTWESQIFDDLGMTNGVLNTDFGTLSSQTTVNILDFEHPLASGLTGIVTVSPTAATFNWGLPTAAATHAVEIDSYGHLASFGYDTGAALVGLTAPARRVGFFFGDTTAQSVNSGGWTLFDGAIKWATNTALPVAATPTFDKAPGVYPAGEEVTVTHAIPAAIIHYTIDGNTPTPNDPAIVSGGTITLGNFTVKARAWIAGSLPSQTTSVVYTITGQFGPGDLAAGNSHALGLRPDGVVWVWGSNTSGQLGVWGPDALAPIPLSGITGVKAISAGNAFSVTLRADGTVWGWGDNSYGQLGVAAANPQLTPIAIEGLTDVAQISAGDNSIVALKNNGTVWAMGANWFGQLGNGTTDHSNVPVQVTGLVNIISVAAGGSHALALDGLGNVSAWGLNHAGQVGDGTNQSPRTTPVPVSIGSVAIIGAGSFHSLAAKTDGTSWGWGDNYYFQTGVDTYNPVHTPQRTVHPAPPSTTAVEGGYGHSLFLRSDGTVWSSGGGDWDVGPVRAGDIADIVRIEAGGISLALAADGVVWAWGTRVGDGTPETRENPVKIAEAGMNWKVGLPVFAPPSGGFLDPPTVTVSSASSGATFRYTTDVENRDPIETDPLFPAAGIIVNQTRTLFVKAWKDGYAPSDTAHSSYDLVVAPVEFTPPPDTYPSPLQVTLTCPTPGATIQYSTDGETWHPYSGPISVSTTTTIQAQSDKTGWYTNWSSGTYQMNFGTLAAPVISPASGPYVSSVEVTLAAAPGAAIRFTVDGSEPTTISTLYSGPFSLTASATVKAKAFHPDYTESPTSSQTYTIQVAAPIFSQPTGTYPVGQTVVVTAPTPDSVIHYRIDGANPTDSDPILASGTVLTLTQSLTLTAGAWKTGCVASAITSATYTISGAAVAGHVAAGYRHSLAATSSGSLWTWGDNGDDQLGDGSGQDRLLPTAIPAAANVLAVAGGTGHSLALRGDGSVLAWGLNDEGQLGNDTRIGVASPTPVPNLVGVAAIATGAKFSLALKQDGTVVAWGDNSNGQLGLGHNTDSLVPVPVPGLTGIIAIAAGDLHSLAVKSNGFVYAWGANTFGQLGVGTTTPSTSPIQVTTLATNGYRVAAGYGFSVALRTDGGVSAWGRNNKGQLGDGTQFQSLSPVSVTGLSAARSVAAGEAHSLAVRTDGSLWVWGANGGGQLGDGSTTDALAPKVVSALSGITLAAGGHAHSLALGHDGRVWAFGEWGVGDGTAEQRLTPVLVGDTNFAWLTGTPVVNPPAGTYLPTSSLAVTLTSATPDVAIHYMTNGSEPTTSSPSVPSGGIVTLDRNTLLRARAWAPSQPPSNIRVASYSLKVSSPSITPPTNATYLYGHLLNATTPTSSATLRYTTDGSTPDGNDPEIPSGGLPLTDTMRFTVIGWRADWVSSDPRFADYSVKVPQPVISLPGGTYQGAQSVTVTNPAPGVTHRYSTNGVEPGWSSPEVPVSGIVEIDRSMTLKVIGRRDEDSWQASETVTASYTITLGPVAAPTATPAAGSYTTPQSVVLSTTTPGATIRYTLDGAAPDLWSPVYTGALDIDVSTTVRAKAFKPDHLASPTLVAAFVIDTGSVAAPTLNPPAGRYPTRRTVTASCATPGATIRYTVNGSAPSEADPEFPQSGLVVDGFARVRVKAWKDSVPESAVRVADYWVTGAISLGSGHALGLKSDGTVWSWVPFGAMPVQVPGLTDVEAISAGDNFSLALKGDGTVWAWGLNSGGQLGDGTTVPHATPAVVSNLTDVVAISAGSAVYSSTDRHSLALRRDGTVWAWGINDNGELGDGTTTQSSLPVQVVGLTGVSRVVAASTYSLAIKTDGAEAGSLWAWGSGDYGQMGDGLFLNTGAQDRLTPVSSLTNVKAVDGGPAFVTAVKADGSLWFWGRMDGALWPNVFLIKPLPTHFPLNHPVVDVAAGSYHAFARSADGRLVAWGSNGDGQLGNGTPLVWMASPFPTVVPVEVVSVAAGGLVTENWAGHGLALGFDGSVWEWGSDHRNPVEKQGFALTPTERDPDHDGLTTFQELALGTDPHLWDTNGDGVSDGVAVASGISATSLDVDADGVPNAAELAKGTDPFTADTDGDGVSDLADAFPLDPLRSTAPPPDPNDHTPPVITLIEPRSAIPLP